MSNEKIKVFYNSRLKEYAKDLRIRATGSEKILWTHLKNKQLLGYDFHRQKPMGEFIFDFYSYPLKLVIELDGYTHSEKEVIENDKRKEKYVTTMGFSILRFKDEEVINGLDGVLDKIKVYALEYRKGELL
jgi:very-short-patch-repair endonuclease